MDADADELSGPPGSRPRTFSSASQHSQLSSKQNFPLMTCDSGLYTCSSNTSDCSLQLESDTDSSHQRYKRSGLKDEHLQLAMQDVKKLRSELERLTKSEQWYKQELRQQKAIRLEDLERIYTQERKFMQENQRLQKECVRLYEKCNEFERELEKQQQKTTEHHLVYAADEEAAEENTLQFENDQQLALIKDQHQLVAVLRKQKRSLLEDLRSLTEEKDEKVMALQRLLADLEFDNKRITKKCSQYAKEHLKLQNHLKQSDSKLSLTLQEKMDLQKTIVDLKDQLEIQQQLIQLKESEIEHTQEHYTNKIQEEQNLDEVHNLSLKYQEEVNKKTLEIINLKGRLHEMQAEIKDIQELQQQNEQQQRQIDQLNFSLEAYRLELQELKSSEEYKNKQLDDLHTSMEQMLKDKEIMYRNAAEQQNDLLRVKQALKCTQRQYEQVQELYKKTQFQIELLEIEHGKVKFHNGKHQQEIEHLRNKLQEYLQQTTELSNKKQILEMELAKVLKQNIQLKEDCKILKIEIQKLEENSLKAADHQWNFSEKNPETRELPLESSNTSVNDDPDFLILQQQCNKLQEKLDFMNNSQNQAQNQQVLQTIQDFMHNIEESKNEDIETAPQSNGESGDGLEKNPDILDLSHQGNKLQTNLDKLKDFFQEKHQLLSSLDNVQHSNEGMKKLVTENEILQKKLCEIETEANAVQLKQDINTTAQEYSKIQGSLEQQKAKVHTLQEKLLENDSKLYKLERKLKILNEADEKIYDLQRENATLKEQLQEQQTSKTDLNRKLLQETNKLEQLKQSLEKLETKQKPTNDQVIQCNLRDQTNESSNEVKELKQQVLQLQQQQRDFLETETAKKEQRLQLLHKMMDLQNNKLQNLQQHQEDWEDMLSSLNQAYSMEEKTRKELELKRMELEELNQVFEEQNEELRKLEEFTNLLELRRRQEKKQLKQAFQQEINVMKQSLKKYEQEIVEQKLLNHQLEKRTERFQQDINEDYGTEVAKYKKEIRELKSMVNKIMEEKEELIEQLQDTEKQCKEVNDNRREAIFMPAELCFNKRSELYPKISVENVKSISEDHLRILTKVLEAEYQRKMQRYDEHIHSLLSNLKGLKKSLKANEEKTALLSEEHLQTKEELKDLQKTKRSLEEMRLKNEQSENTIKELKQALAFERKKFELSDIGKSARGNGSTYEVANLIDDYKKLIQQSALATKRPTTSAILDLIQRSNQCVPNLQKLENNVDELRSGLQNFLASYSPKMPATSLIAAASLSIPPSLMDELRVASEGF